MVMYMREPSPDQEGETRLALSPTATVVLALAAAGVVIFGIYPWPLVSLTASAALP